MGENDAECPKRVLVLGYGNPGRLDDGLGPILAQTLERKQIDGVRAEANYILNLEDASTAADYDTVVFVDASVNGREPFYFERIEPVTTLSFSSHHLEPSAILGLTADLFDGAPQGWVLGIRGYEFNEFGERLSARAQRNLDAALQFLEEAIRTGRFETIENDTGA